MGKLGLKLSSVSHSAPSSVVTKAGMHVKRRPIQLRMSCLDPLQYPRQEDGKLMPESPLGMGVQPLWRSAPSPLTRCTILEGSSLWWNIRWQLSWPQPLKSSRPQTDTPSPPSFDKNNWRPSPTKVKSLKSLPKEENICVCVFFFF